MKKIPLLENINLNENIILDDFKKISKEAQEESKKGFVQHVNVYGKNEGDIAFKIEDWSDSSNTVASYENGTELYKEFFESTEDIEEWIVDHAEN
jgi:hypothetical protein